METHVHPPFNACRGPVLLHTLYDHQDRRLLPVPLRRQYQFNFMVVVYASLIDVGHIRFTGYLIRRNKYLASALNVKFAARPGPILRALRLLI